MTFRILFFKQSGKYYSESTVDVPGTFYEASEHIRQLHREGNLPGLLGGGKTFDVLVMGNEHPQGFPFISRAVNFLP